MYQIPYKLITASIVNFCEMSDLGRSKVYQLLDAGDLDSIKVGKRRLIILDSYRKLIERQRAAGATTRTAESHSPAPLPIDAADEIAGRCETQAQIEDISAGGISSGHRKAGHPPPRSMGKGAPLESGRYRVRTESGEKSSTHEPPSVAPQGRRGKTSTGGAA